jgi:hypothetical protein
VATTDMELSRDRLGLGPDHDSSLRYLETAIMDLQFFHCEASAETYRYVMKRSKRVRSKVGFLVWEQCLVLRLERRKNILSPIIIGGK